MPYTFPLSHTFQPSSMQLSPSSASFSSTFHCKPLHDSTIATLQSCLQRRVLMQIRHPLGYTISPEIYTSGMQNLLLKCLAFHSKTAPNPVCVSLKSPLTPRSHSCPVQVHLSKLPLPFSA